jgi:deoxycytidine triphosphate deaminase
LKEAVQVLPDYIAEMVPFDTLVGEFRVHYAGSSATRSPAGAARARC